MTAVIIPFPRRSSDVAPLSPGWSKPAAPAHNGATTDAISLPRCIDWLLDRHQSTTDPALRALVADVLREVRELGPVCEEPELAELVIGALGSVEAAFDLSVD